MIVPLTPLDFLERARRQYGELEGVIEGDRRLRYDEFAGRAYALARLLRARGVEPGDRVAYLCPNSLELLEAYFGVLLAGAILVPLNIRLAPAELQAIVADCRPRLLAVHPTLANLAESLVDVEVLSLGAGYEVDLAAMDASSLAWSVPDENAVCELFYTSGTTGSPKGAMLTHRNLATHAIDSALSMTCHHRDVVLHTIPLFHVNGWGTPHWVTLLGASHVLVERWDPAEVLRLIEAEGVTRLHLVPTMAATLVTCADFGVRDTSSLTQVTVGGAPPGPDLMAELENGLGCEVICGYGMTEAGPQMTKALTKRSHDGLPLGEQRSRRATTGLPNVGVELRVVDSNGHEVEPDGRSVGEIVARSNHVMAGYWERPDATDEVVIDGWLYTGDLAVVDDEGYVRIVDRKKDLIISGGENISSIEVEEALCGHPAVLEAAVVAMPHDRWGEVPRAFVTLRVTGDEMGSAPDERALAEFVAGRLAKFKVPKRIDIVDDLPKGGSGKILKNELRRRS